MGFKCPDPPTSQRAGKEFLNKTIEDLMNVSGRNQIHWLPTNAPLQGENLGFGTYLTRLKIYCISFQNQMYTVCF